MLTSIWASAKSDQSHICKQRHKCCQFKDFSRDKRKCVCDKVKIDILKAIKNEKVVKNELFQNFGPNFSNIDSKLPEHFLAFSCGKSAHFLRVSLYKV